VVIKGASMEEIVEVLRHDELYPHPEMLVTFIGNHDDRRFVSEVRKGQFCPLVAVLKRELRKHNCPKREIHPRG
jgi:hypothetical protein